LIDALRDDSPATRLAVLDASTSLRRRLLMKGELTALCLTAFGDAGWQLGGRRA
jgi:hypothetical protein